MHEEEPWFAPKRFGYGAGLPIAWQGWALLAGYTLIMLAPALVLEWDPVIGLGFAIVVWLCATLALVFIAKRKTRGGWRWRHGEDD